MRKEEGEDRSDKDREVREAAKSRGSCNVTYYGSGAENNGNDEDVVGDEEMSIWIQRLRTS
jgi:hypothetical protein